jgi:hypothetical protein
VFFDDFVRADSATAGNGWLQDPIPPAEIIDFTLFLDGGVAQVWRGADQGTIFPSQSIVHYTTNAGTGPAPTANIIESYQRGNGPRTGSSADNYTFAHRTATGLSPGSRIFRQTANVLTPLTTPDGIDPTILGPWSERNIIAPVTGGLGLQLYIAQNISTGSDLTQDFGTPKRTATSSVVHPGGVSGILAQEDVNIARFFICGRHIVFINAPTGSHLEVDGRGAIASESANIITWNVDDIALPVEDNMSVFVGIDEKFSFPAGQSVFGGSTFDFVEGAFPTQSLVGGESHGQASAVATMLLPLGLASAHGQASTEAGLLLPLNIAEVHGHSQVHAQLAIPVARIDGSTNGQSQVSADAVQLTRQVTATAQGQSQAHALLTEVTEILTGTSAGQSQTNADVTRIIGLSGRSEGQSQAFSTLTEVTEILTGTVHGQSSVSNTILNVALRLNEAGINGQSQVSAPLQLTLRGAFKGSAQSPGSVAAAVVLVLRPSSVAFGQAQVTGVSQKTSRPTVRSVGLSSAQAEIRIDFAYQGSPRGQAQVRAMLGFKVELVPAPQPKIVFVGDPLPEIVIVGDSEPTIVIVGDAQPNIVIVD